MLAFGQTGWNFQREVLFDAIAAVGAHKHFHGDFGARFHFAGRNPGVFDHGFAAIRQNVDRGIHRFEFGDLHRIEEQAIKLVAPPSGELVGNGRWTFVGGQHGGE